MVDESGAELCRSAMFEDELKSWSSSAFCIGP